MTEPLLALMGKTAVGFFKKRTYLLIFAEDQTILVPAEDLAIENLGGMRLQNGETKSPAAESTRNTLVTERELEKDASSSIKDRLPGAVYLDNSRISQVTLTATGVREENLKLRYTLEITSDTGSYEFELEGSAHSGMFNLNTILAGIFGKRFAPFGD